MIDVKQFKFTPFTSNIWEYTTNVFCRR